MSESLIALSAACTLLSADVELTATPDGGLVEHTRIVVESKGGCRAVDLALPSGVHLRGHSAKLKLSDDTKRKLGPERMELLPRGLEDEGLARLHVPELLKYDRVLLEVEREWEPGAWFRWDPLAEGAERATLTTTGATPMPGSWPRLDGSSVVLERRGSGWIWTPDQPDGHEGVLVLPAAESPAEPPTIGGDRGPAQEAWRRASAMALVPRGVAGDRLPALEAWRRASAMALVPRGVDGQEPLAGEAALARGAADDRGFASTLHALSSEPITIGLVGERLLEARSVPLLADGDGWIALLHPDMPWDGAPVYDEHGAVYEGVRRVDAEPPARVEPDPVRVQRTFTLEVPDGDVQTGLYPGGGSALRTKEQLTFAPSTAGRAWLVPLPPGHGAVDVTVEPADTATTVRVREDAVIVVAAPSEEQTVVHLQWSTPDAPACGEVRARPGEQLEWAVLAPKGRVRTEGDFWSLTSWNDQPVMPDRRQVLAGLSYRFNGRSMPEPGLPMELRGRELDTSLVEELRPTLLDRTRVADLPGDPLWPRKLLKARKSEVVTPVEAALILRLYAMQMRVPATWALVRPADQGPGDLVCPVGYDEGLTLIEWEDQPRWIDPSCEVCAPWELRPWLEGASAYSPVIVETPAPTRGKQVLRVGDGEVDASFEGPAALLVRLALQEVPKERREAALAAYVAGEGASLVSSEGVDVPGAPIRVVAKGWGTDPLALPAPREDGSIWLDWIGPRARWAPPAGPERDLVRGAVPTEDGDAAMAWTAETRRPVDVDLGPVRYVRKIEDGRVVEVLDVRERRIDAAIASQLKAIREGRDVPADAPKPQPFRAVVLAPTALDPVAPAAEPKKDSGPTKVGLESEAITLPAMHPIEVVLLGSGPREGQALIRDEVRSGWVARADLVTFPFRARLESKSATVPLRARPASGGRAVEQLPVAGDAVFVKAIEGDWAMIDVEGPLSYTRRIGWVPLKSLSPETAAHDPITPGDLPLSAWTPLEGVGVVLDEPTVVRGVRFPRDTILATEPSGAFVSATFPHEVDVGGITLPAGGHVDLPDSCDFAVHEADGVGCYRAGADGRLERVE